MRNRIRPASLLGRFALVMSIAICGSLALATAVGAAGGGKLVPGEYVFTSISASATQGTGKPGAPSTQGVNVYVNRGLNSYQPEDGAGTVTNSTMVNVVTFSPTGGAYGCFVIDPSEFTVSRDLQSASLHTTLTAANACPGVGAPVTGKTDVAPKPSGGGGLPLPMTIDLTWKGFGVTSTSRDRSTFECLDYSTQSTLVARSAGAAATGTVSIVSGPFKSDAAGVTSTDSRLAISGTPNPACFSF